MLTQLLQKVKATLPINYATIDEAQMANVLLDNIERTKPWCYIEEYHTGTYGGGRFATTKRTNVEMFLGRFCDFEMKGEDRQIIREKIEEEQVAPILRMLNSVFNVTDVTFASVFPRFDSNEVSIRLSFVIVEPFC